jgi:subtilisin-like proprotein convertase family protein
MAYADDLVIFLSSPREWQVIMNILKLYDKASNAKVNLEKTIVFPMAGNAQTEWQVIIDNASGKWHDQNLLKPPFILASQFFIMKINLQDSYQSY